MSGDLDWIGCSHDDVFFLVSFLVVMFFVRNCVCSVCVFVCLYVCLVMVIVCGRFHLELEYLDMDMVSRFSCILHTL